MGTWRASKQGLDFHMSKQEILNIANFQKKVIQQNQFNALFNPQVLQANATNFTFPPQWDGRMNRTNCTAPTRPRFSCGSDWAFAAVDSIGDRACVALNITNFSNGSNYTVNTTFSVQDVLECNSRVVQCSGGYAAFAGEISTKFGLRKATCNQYNPYSFSKCSGGNLTACSDKFRVFTKNSSYYSNLLVDSNITIYVNNTNMTKQEIYSNGSVVALMQVYDDFRLYAGGIYEHKRGGLIGYLNVRLVGYGIDPLTNRGFWVGANAENQSWGEGGFFRIFEGDSGIESYIIAFQVDTVKTKTGVKSVQGEKFTCASE